jgi:hypothetical protein
MRLFTHPEIFVPLLIIPFVVIALAKALKRMKEKKAEADKPVS